MTPMNVLFRNRMSSPKRLMRYGIISKSRMKKSLWIRLANLDVEFSTVDKTGPSVDEKWRSSVPPRANRARFNSTTVPTQVRTTSRITELLSEQPAFVAVQLKSHLQQWQRITSNPFLITNHQQQRIVLIRNISFRSLNNKPLTMKLPNFYLKA